MNTGSDPWANLGSPVPSPCEVISGVYLDVRRAIFLERAGALLVSDLHLGHPARPDDLHAEEMRARLLELERHYEPAEVCLLGDVIDARAPGLASRGMLLKCVNELRQQCRLSWLVGNHDESSAGPLVRELGVRAQVWTETERDGFRLLHGHLEPAPVDQPFMGRAIIGHEHPAVAPVGMEPRPSFLVSPSLIVMPAFSPLVENYTIYARPFLSRLAHQAEFHMAVAICNQQLVRIDL